MSNPYEVSRLRYPYELQLSRLRYPAVTTQLLQRDELVCDATISADEIRKNLLGLHLQFCGGSSMQRVQRLSVCFACMCIFLQSQRRSGPVGLFVHTPVIIPDFICRMCTWSPHAKKLHPDILQLSLIPILLSFCPHSHLYAPLCSIPRQCHRHGEI